MPVHTLTFSYTELRPNSGSSNWDEPGFKPDLSPFLHASIICRSSCGQSVSRLIQNFWSMDFSYHEEYVKNSRGVQLFTCRWVPLSSPKALVFLCHGYGMECSNFMKGVGTKLASHGFAVFGIDYEGHGRSMGSRCYIKRFQNIINDASEHFEFICGQEDYKEKRRFLYGESMGGAVALLTHKKQPTFWDGAVLVAPMCKISDKFKPHPAVISVLTMVEDIIPGWKIVPTKDVIDTAFKDHVKREQIRSNKLLYEGKPRLKTALELLRTSMNLEQSLNEVTMPFLILHGEADALTDPEVSLALYEQASSMDKTIKLYPGMWHGLTAGEPDSNAQLVFSDIISWLDKRARDDYVKDFKPIPVVLDGSVTRVSPMTAKKSKQHKMRPHPKYLCGWKGMGMQHHEEV